VVATLFIATLGYKNIKGALVTRGVLIVGLGWLFFSQVTRVPLALGFIAFCGLGIMLTFNTANALLQMHTPDHLRGRVMSTYMIMLQGTNTFAALLMGTLASSLGEQAAVFIAGATLVVNWLFLAWRVPGLGRME
jgi:MFS family permease